MSDHETPAAINVSVSTDADILRSALEAQRTSGLTAAVVVLINRLPGSRYIKQMRLKTNQGPWGRIIELRQDGTLVSFEAHRLITYFSVDVTAGRKKIEPRAGKVQIHPMLSRENAERLTAEAGERGITVSALLELALTEYFGAPPVMAEVIEFPRMVETHADVL